LSGGEYRNTRRKEKKERQFGTKAQEQYWQCDQSI